MLPISFGYRAEEEGHQPSKLLELANFAQKAGFQFMPISDHFHPWFHTGASGGFAWSWIAAAAATVPNIRLGTMVTAPIGRYHPAVIAQAFATMDEIYPNRFFLGLGTGEAMNELPLGFPWPSFRERFERVKESLEIIRELWKSDFLNYRGEFYSLDGANLYTKPRGKIPIYVVANGPKSASLAGRYADGFGTIDSLMTRFNELWDAVERSAREAGRDPTLISKHVELCLCYSKDYDKGLESVRKWKSALIPGIFNLTIHDPRELENQGERVSDSQLTKAWTIATNSDELIRKAEKAIQAGFNEIQFHSASPSEREFLSICSHEVLPYLTSQYGR